MHLPRQTYLKPEHAEREEMIAEMVATAAGLMQMKIGIDDPDKQKPRFDRVFCLDGTIRRFAEIKCLNYQYRDTRIKGYAISVRKVLLGRQLYEILRVPVILIQAWNDNTITSLNVLHQYETWDNWGRKDRNDPADIETAAFFQWDDLTVITR